VKTLVVSTLVLVLMAVDSICRGQSLPEAASASLAANATALNGVELRWRRTRTPLLEPARVLDAIGISRTYRTFFQDRETTFRCEGGKYFESSSWDGLYDDEHGKRTIAEVQQRAFDGRKYYYGDPREKAGDDKIDPILNIDSVERKRKEHAAQTWQPPCFEPEYLEAAGFALPVYSGELGSARPASLVLKLVAAGRLESVKEVEGAGRRLLEVVVRAPDPWALNRDYKESDPSFKGLTGDGLARQIEILKQRRSLAGKDRTHRFHLDPQLNYAVRAKWETRHDGKLLFATACDEFEAVGDSKLRLPKVCKVEAHTWETRPGYVSDAPLLRTEYRLVGIAHRAFSDDDFRLWYKAIGSSVVDTTLTPDGRPVAYRVPASGVDLDRVISEAMRGGDRPQGSVDWTWLILVNVAILGVIAAAVVIRKRLAR